MLAAVQHVQAMQASAANFDCKIGLIGPIEAQQDCARWLCTAWPEAQVVVTAEEGFEQVTINAMHEWCKQADPATPVLYCHTKGAWNASSFNEAWRQSMTSYCVNQWQRCVSALDEVDMTGLHYLTPEKYPGTILTPIFGGNFWWARAGYLAKLPPVDVSMRHGAEAWIGEGNPRATVVCPNWDQWPIYGSWPVPVSSWELEVRTTYVLKPLLGFDFAGRVRQQALVIERFLGVFDRFLAQV